ncbi:MAG: lipB [Gemmataceae bacterium]|nr:lipB [Gemmataceae bacterium]
MTEGAEAHQVHPAPGRALHAYLLGRLEFDHLLALQRRLVYDVAGDRDAGAVILCDHPPGVTIGREGSRVHVRPRPEELTSRGWPVRWVSRGGGVLLHLPGQVACYPLIALDRLGLTPGEYLHELQAIVLDLLRAYDLPAEADPVRPGVRVKGRRIAHVGVAVRDWVSCFGIVLNVHPDLEPFYDVHCDGDPLPMTSVQRESPARVRVAGVRQKLVELVAARFRFDRVSVFHAHPGLVSRSPFPPGSAGGGLKHAVPTRTR